MNIGVIGVGYVGLVTAACLADSGANVICMDTNEKKIEDLKAGIIPIYEPGLTEIVQRACQSKRLKFTTSIKETVDTALLLYIAVGTPSSIDGSADLTAVINVAEQIAEHMTGYRIVIAKSTVPVGTHKKITEVIKSKTDQPFDYVSNPEFLKEGSAIDDFMKPERVIIGTNDSKVMEIMKQLYAPFMRRKERMIFMDPMSAELTKYAANCMLATRISFMNELSALCETVGADIEAIRQGIGSDSRIGNNFLFPGIGFGGSCFPKDIRALIKTGQSHSCTMSIIEASWDANLRQQKRFAERIINYYSSQKETALAVWGLAFKARTDDIRESPAINCIKALLEEGIKIKVYDPEAMENSKQELSGNIEFCDEAYDTLTDSDGLVVLTDWQQFRNPDFELINQKLKRPVLFDGRNLYEPKYVISKGLEYHGIGRINGLSE